MMRGTVRRGRMDSGLRERRFQKTAARVLRECREACSYRCLMARLSRRHCRERARERCLRESGEDLAALDTLWTGLLYRAKRTPWRLSKCELRIANFIMR